MSGIEERPVSREEVSNWGAFVKEYLNVNLYLGPSKTLIITELFGGFFVLAIVGTFIMNPLVPIRFLSILIGFSVVMFYWGMNNFKKYLGWRARRNEWIRRATG